jgi:hypothetical protein
MLGGGKTTPWLPSHPGYQQESTGGDCEHHERAEIVILRMTAHRAFSSMAVGYAERIILSKVHA